MNSKYLALHVSLRSQWSQSCEGFIWVQPQLICIKERLQGADLPPPLLCEPSEQNDSEGKEDVREGGMRGPITLRPSCPSSLSLTRPVLPLGKSLHISFPSLSCLLIPRSGPSFLRPSRLVSVSRSPSSIPHSASFPLSSRAWMHVFECPTLTHKG